MRSIDSTVVNPDAPHPHSPGKGGSVLGPKYVSKSMKEMADLQFYYFGNNGGSAINLSNFLKLP